MDGLIDNRCRHVVVMDEPAPTGEVIVGAP